jgi:hypothetical protein
MGLTSDRVVEIGRAQLASLATRLQVRDEANAALALFGVPDHRIELDFATFQTPLYS